MTITADLHTHTTKSYTGSSTLFENLSYASKAKLNSVAVTDYGPGARGSKKELIEYMAKLPSKAYNINIIKGIEADVLDLHSGKLDIEENEIESFDWVIGSYHQISEYDSKILSFSILTSLFERLASNPLVNTIGHMERYSCGFDIEKIIPLMKKNGKVMEIGAAPFKEAEDSREKKILSDILDSCKNNSAPICIVSNAHYCDEVGKFDFVIKYLEEINFPEQLIINSNTKLLNSYIENFKQMRSTAIKKERENFGVPNRLYTPTVYR